MMDTDDLDPIKKKVVKKDLARMSIGDLNDYIDELKAEISRAEAEIKAAQNASHFKAVEAHYEIASAYLDLIHGDNPAPDPNPFNI